MHKTVEHTHLHGTQAYMSTLYLYFNTLKQTVLKCNFNSWFKLSIKTALKIFRTNLSSVKNFFNILEIWNLFRVIKK